MTAADEHLPFTKEEWAAAAANVTRQMFEYVAPFCTAISQHRGDHGEAWGTGSFLRFGNGAVILTNEHVAEVRSAENHLIYPLGNDDEMHFVRGNHVSYGWPFDIALLPVAKEIWSGGKHRAKAITPDLIALAHNPVPNELLMFAGFSDKRSGFYFDTLVSRGTTSLSREVPLPTDERFNSRFHFGLDYRPEFATKAVGSTDLPYPPGFSGSAVWNTRFVETKMADKKWTPELAQVTGLVWGWPDKIGHIVATRSEYIRSFLLTAPDVLAAADASGRTQGGN